MTHSWSGKGAKGVNRMRGWRFRGANWTKERMGELAEGTGRASCSAGRMALRIGMPQEA